MRFTVYIICLVLLVSCYEEPKRTKPDNLIAKDKMADILFDVHLLNSGKTLNKKLLEVRGVFPEKYLFEKYNIDSLQFAESNDYYAYNPEEYQSIIDSLKSRIDREQTKYQNLKKVEDEVNKKQLDSIQARRRLEKDSLLKNNKLRNTKFRDSI